MLEKTLSHVSTKVTRKLRYTSRLAREYAVYRQHAYWAATAQDVFPLDPAATFVITVASYPARIHLVPAVFESLARQTIKPRHAYLVLSEEEFPSRKVPRPVERLEARGVRILWTRNNPYAVKKLVPVWELRADCAVCAFDDDVIYGTDVIEGLARHASAYDRPVIGYCGKTLYRKGNQISMWCRDCVETDEETPSPQIYLIGKTGIWYSKNSLHPEVTNVEAINRIVPGRGSDIWFWAAALAADAQHVCISSSRHSRTCIDIPKTKRTQPRDQPGDFVLDQRFQMAIDFFGIRQKLLDHLPDREVRETVPDSTAIGPLSAGDLVDLR